MSGSVRISGPSIPEKFSVISLQHDVDQFPDLSDTGNDLARSTQNTVREFIRSHPAVYCSTHTPLGYENLEAKRVMDLDNPPETIWPTDDCFVLDEGTGKYFCSVCGYVYDPAEHDGAAFEDFPDGWKCPRCKQPKEKFNKA